MNKLWLAGMFCIAYVYYVSSQITTMTQINSYGMHSKWYLDKHVNAFHAIALSTINAKSDIINQWVIQHNYPHLHQ